MELIGPEKIITDEVTLLHTPGHTPGSVTVLVQSAGEAALLIGDVAHHPAELTETDWSPMADIDPVLSARSRKAMVEHAMRINGIIASAHSPAKDPAFGRMVQIEGRKGTPASCTTEVAAGMKVRTHGDLLDRLRKNVLELYLSEHPMGSCPDGARCELEALATKEGVARSRYASGEGRGRPGETADASNPYNTYANAGYPIGPIGNPGDAAINGAVNPAEGAWLFFVPINLKTGETVFSETADQHAAAVAQLKAWCRESAENASYCA